MVPTIEETLTNLEVLSLHANLFIRQRIFDPTHSIFNLRKLLHKADAPASQAS